MAENPAATDLLGDPWTEARDPRGRKRHRRLPQIAETVAVLRAGDHTEDEIAARVGLSAPTLRKYYFRELDRGPSLAKAVLREKLWRLAMAGNVSAAKAMLAEFAKGDVVRPVRSKPVREEPLGKKAEAERDAKTAHKGTGWGELLQ